MYTLSRIWDWIRRKDSTTKTYIYIDQDQKEHLMSFSPDAIRVISEPGLESVPSLGFNPGFTTESAKSADSSNQSKTIAGRLPLGWIPSDFKFSKDLLNEVRGYNLVHPDMTDETLTKKLIDFRHSWNDLFPFMTANRLTFQYEAGIVLFPKKEEKMPEYIRYDDIFKTYRRKPEPVQAVKITEQNAKHVARLVGGDIGTPIGKTQGAVLFYPMLDDSSGAVKFGDYLIKDQDGKLSTMTSDEFEYEYEASKRPTTPIPPIQFPPGVKSQIL